jgi:hypothetical protein
MAILESGVFNCFEGVRDSGRYTGKAAGCILSAKVNLVHAGAGWIGNEFVAAKREISKAVEFSISIATT